MAVMVICWLLSMGLAELCACATERVTGFTVMVPDVAVPALSLLESTIVTLKTQFDVASFGVYTNDATFPGFEKPGHVPEPTDHV